MPKRRCPVCRSREWHKEPSSGLITCSEGHVLQNYRNETTETTELGPHELRKRTIKSGRVTKEPVTKADGRLYHGPRARYHYFECLQLLLRMQISALVKAWNLPTEFEIACRDVWALHLSLLPHPPPPEPYFYARGQAGEPTLDQGSSLEAANSDEVDNINPESSSSSSATDSENDVAEEDTGRDTLLADLLHEASQSESSEDDGVNDAAAKGATAPLKKSRNKYEVPAANVAVLMLACWTMRLPVMYMDLIRLIESYTLPYLDPVRLLPIEMKRHLAKATVLALSPRFPPRPFVLHALTSRLARLCWSTYGIHTPEMNVAPLLWRMVRAMCGTSTLYALTKSTAKTLSLPLTLHPSLSPALVQSKRHRDPKRHKNDNIPPELALAAAVTVVLKLVYGLDGTERRPVVGTDPACSLPQLDDYLAALRAHDEAAHADLFSGISHATVLDEDEGQLDLYLDFCERALLGNEQPNDKVVAEFFPLNGDGAQAHDNAAAAPQTPLRAVDLVPGTEAIPPGRLVRIYNTLDVLGTVPGAYGTVLEAGARFIGVGADDVAGVVERFERRLVRRAEIVRSQS